MTDRFTLRCLCPTMWADSCPIHNPSTGTATTTTSASAYFQSVGLDVERLALALEAHMVKLLAEPESYDSPRAVAESIAAEYEREGRTP